MQMDVSMDKKLERNYSLKSNLSFKCFGLEKFGFGSEDGPYGTFWLSLLGGKIIRMTNMWLG